MLAFAFSSSNCSLSPSTTASSLLILFRSSVSPLPGGLGTFGRRGAYPGPGYTHSIFAFWQLLQPPSSLSHLTFRRRQVGQDRGLRPRSWDCVRFGSGPLLVVGGSFSCCVPGGWAAGLEDACMMKVFVVGGLVSTLIASQSRSLSWRGWRVMMTNFSQEAVIKSPS